MENDLFEKDTRHGNVTNRMRTGNHINALLPELFPMTLSISDNVIFVGFTGLRPNCEILSETSTESI